MIVVDDDDGVRVAFGRLLKAAGFSTTAYASGDELLAAAPVTADCLLVDYHLPRMTGLELIASLARLQTLPRVVMVTADVDRDLPARVRAQNVQALLLKPVDSSRLLAAIAGETAGELQP